MKKFLKANQFVIALILIVFTLTTFVFLSSSKRFTSIIDLLPIFQNQESGEGKLNQKQSTSIIDNINQSKLSINQDKIKKIVPVIDSKYIFKVNITTVDENLIYKYMYGDVIRSGFNFKQEDNAFQVNIYYNQSLEDRLNFIDEINFHFCYALLDIQEMLLAEKEDRQPNYKKALEPGRALYEQMKTNNSYLIDYEN